MTKSTIAASAASFALTLALSAACIQANAQFVGGVSENVQGEYKAPTSAAVAQTETPAAPTLQGASCGTIGPQGADTSVQGINTAVDGDALVAGKFDAGSFLRGFNLEQFRGKLTDKAFAFIETLQNLGHTDKPLKAPSGYTVVRTPSAVGATAVP